MNEASETHLSAPHTFREVWQILQSLFSSGSPNYFRALNLQYYQLGHFYYSCLYQEGRGLALKKFDYTKRTSNNYPEFECSLARGGCNGDNDHHYRPVWRACRGETCVRYVKEKQDTGMSKVTATLNIGSWGDMGWHGCDWRVWTSYCACYGWQTCKEGCVVFAQQRWRMRQSTSSP